MVFDRDAILFTPRDVDLARSPMRASLGDEKTYILAAFNPGFTRLPNGNLLMMVRVAEALSEPTTETKIKTIRWTPKGQYTVDAHDLASADASDPRKFCLGGYSSCVMGLTSLSWLLPVELTPDGSEIISVHYDYAIEPRASYQEYGVEDARISLIDGTYYMTACSVSAERHCTTLYTSTDGLSYELHGVILDHQNKDMLFFEGRVNGKFYALTRPLGSLYFCYPFDSEFEPGPSINLASSPDSLHWKPSDHPLIRPRRGSTSSMKVGGGSAPILTPKGWLMLYHGVQPAEIVGTYRTFYAFLDLENPEHVISLHDDEPLLESRPELTEPIRDLRYLSGVVFTTGVVDAGDHYIVASGEDDLACRITHIPKAVFGL